MHNRLTRTLTIIASCRLFCVNVLIESKKRLWRSSPSPTTGWERLIAYPVSPIRPVSPSAISRQPVLLPEPEIQWPTGRRAPRTIKRSSRVQSKPIRRVEGSRHHRAPEARRGGTHADSSNSWLSREEPRQVPGVLADRHALRPSPIPENRIAQFVDRPPTWLPWLPRTVNESAWAL